MLGYYMLWFKLILTTWISCGCLSLCEIFWYQCKRDLKTVYFYISSNLPMVISVTHVVGVGVMGIPPCIPCEGDVTKPDGKGEVNFRLVGCLIRDRV